MKKDSSVVAAGESSGACPRIPRIVWALGMVSLCMDFSSELIHAILPVFLTVELGASPVAIGLLEGGAEAVVSVMKVLSGFFSDWTRQRKPYVVAGYGIAALTKPLFPSASGITVIFFARFLDRVGKGIRGAPRDAIMAASAPPTILGACFGLRQSLDTVGAILGPVAALLLLRYSTGGLRGAMWWGTPPALVAVLVLVFCIQEPEESSAPRDHTVDLSIWDLGPTFWRVVLLGLVITFARSSEAFLILRVSGLGLPIWLTPVVLITMNILYAVSAYPVGALSDRVGRSGMLSISLGLLCVSCIVLVFASSPMLGLVGAALWGLHLGFSQGVLSAMIGESVPTTLLGRAFGMYNLVTALALIAGNLLVGSLWQEYGPAVAYAWGAGLCLLACSWVEFGRAIGRS